MHVLALSDAGWAAVAGIVVAFLTAFFTYMGILANRSSKEQTSKVNTAVAAVEKDLTEGQREYENRGRIIDALQRDLAVVETRATRLEEREQRCLEALEDNMRRIAVLEARNRIDDD